jgi:hypothetical protein
MTSLSDNHLIVKESVLQEQGLYMRLAIGL